MYKGMLNIGTEPFFYFAGVDNNNKVIHLYMETIDIELYTQDITKADTAVIMDNITATYVFSASSTADYTATALTMYDSDRSLSDVTVTFDTTEELDYLINEWEDNVTATYEPLLNNEELFVEYTCYNGTEDITIITVEDYLTQTAPSWATAHQNGTLELNTPGVTVDTVYQFVLRSTFQGTDYFKDRIITIFIDYTAPPTPPVLPTTASSTTTSTSTTSTPVVSVNSSTVEGGGGSKNSGI